MGRDKAQKLIHIFEEVLNKVGQFDPDNERKANTSLCHRAAIAIREKIPDEKFFVTVSADFSEYRESECWSCVSSTKGVTANICGPYNGFIVDVNIF